MWQKLELEVADAFVVLKAMKREVVVKRTSGMRRWRMMMKRHLRVLLPLFVVAAVAVVVSYYYYFDHS